MNDELNETKPNTSWIPFKPFSLHRQFVFQSMRSLTFIHMLNNSFCRRSIQIQNVH